jgi:hypothetical protein
LDSKAIKCIYYAGGRSEATNRCLAPLIIKYSLNRSQSIVRVTLVIAKKIAGKLYSLDFHPTSCYRLRES